MYIWGFGQTELVNANLSTKYPISDCIKGLDDFKRRIFYFACIEVHSIFFNSVKDAMDAINYFLPKYSEILGVNLRGDNELAQEFWKRVLTKNKDGSICSSDEFLNAMKNIHKGNDDFIEFIVKKIEEHLCDNITKPIRYKIAVYNKEKNMTHFVSFNSVAKKENIQKILQSIAGYSFNDNIAIWVARRLLNEGCTPIKLSYSYHNMPYNNGLSQKVKMAIIGNDDSISSKVRNILENYDIVYYAIDDLDENLSGFAGTLCLIRNDDSISINKASQQYVDGKPLFVEDVGVVRDYEYKNIIHYEKEESVFIKNNEEAIINYLLYSNVES